MIDKFKRPNTLMAIYIPRPTDKALFQEFSEKFESCSKKELVDAYNKIEQITGVHSQIVYLVVMHKTFQKRFKKSPFVIEDAIAIGLGPKIHYSDQTNDFVYLS